MENMASEFLDELKDDNSEKVECLIKWADSRLLTATLKVIYAKLKRPSTNELSTQTILRAIFCILKRYDLFAEQKLLLILRDTLHVHFQIKPLASVAFMQREIDSFCEVMKKEIEILISIPDFGVGITLAHILSVAFPVMSHPPYFGIRKNFPAEDVMYKGPKSSKINMDKLKALLQTTFPEVFNICQIENCPMSYQFLLLKMIFWADQVNVLSNLIPIEKLIRVTKRLIYTNPINHENMFTGLAIVNTLCHKHMSSLLDEKINELSINVKLFFEMEGRLYYQWILHMYESLKSAVTYWPDETKVDKMKIDYKNLTSQLKTMNSTLDSILSETDNGMTAEMSLDISYCNLRKLVENILNLPDMSCYKGKVTVGSEGVKRFRDLVISTVKTLYCIIYSGFTELQPDLYEKQVSVPSSSTDTLNLYKSPSFNRVLGSSKSPEGLKKNPLVRTLRLLSILYEVNEHWLLLFGRFSTERIIDESHFISKIVEEAIYKASIHPIDDSISFFVYELATNYTFLTARYYRNLVSKLQIPISYTMFRNGDPGSSKVSKRILENEDVLEGSSRDVCRSKDSMKSSSNEGRRNHENGDKNRGHRRKADEADEDNEESRHHKRQKYADD